MWKKFCAALLLMLLLPACALAEVVISEIMTSNGTYENGHAYDWIELHNTGKSTVDISGWYLSDSKKNKMKFQFPQGTKLKAAGYLTVFCTGDDEVDVGKGSEFYATFALSSSGESIYLSDADGNQLQKLKYPQQYGCVSYGTPMMAQPTASSRTRRAARRTMRPSIPDGWMRLCWTRRAASTRTA